jgi:hypothetical protein
VHSYGGRRYLYPAPARFVNHAEDPSCYQDFDRGCDVALRPITRGEPVTIDAGQETARELGTFLDAYRERHDLADLVDAEAVLWHSGRVFRGRDAVVAALLGKGPLTDVEWLVGTGRWEAVCSGTDADKHVTMLLKVIRGNWQMVYQHSG